MGTAGPQAGEEEAGAAVADVEGGSSAGGKHKQGARASPPRGEEGEEAPVTREPAAKRLRRADEAEGEAEAAGEEPAGEEAAEAAEGQGQGQQQQEGAETAREGAAGAEAEAGTGAGAGAGGGGGIIEKGMVQFFYRWAVAMY